MFAASQAVLYYTVKYMMKHLEGGDPERQRQLEKGNKTLERIGLKDADLDEHERQFISSERLSSAMTPQQEPLPLKSLHQTI